MGEHLVKKLSAFLNTPVKVVAALGLIVLVTETLLMALIGFQDTHLKNSLPEAAWALIDSIVLTAIVSTSLYILIFRPMCYQQADLIGFQDTHLKNSLPEAAWALIDSIVLTAIVSTSLYILIFRPMCYQQAE